MKLDTNGEVVFMYAGNDGKYYAKIKYWIGVGYQYVHREVPHGTYEGWVIDNE